MRVDGKTSQNTFYGQWHLFLVVEFTLPSSGSSPGPPLSFCNHSELPLINNYLSIEHDMTVLLVFEFKPIHLHQGRKTHQLYHCIIFLDQELFYNWE